MGTYGEDLIGLAFQDVDSDSFFGGQLEGVVKGAVGEYARTGRVDLDQLGQRSLRRAGERLFDQSVDRLADEIERAIGTRAGDVAELARTWNGLVEEAEAALERPIESVRELRTLARRVQIDGEHRARLLTQILADAPLDDVLEGLHVEDLPLDRVWRRYRDLEAAGDDALRTLATQATDHLIDAIVPPNVDEAVRSTWAELHHGLEGAGRTSGLRDVYTLLEGLAEAELDDDAVHRVWEHLRRALALGAELKALFELPATRLLHADIAPLLDRPLLESFPALEDLRPEEMRRPREEAQLRRAATALELARAHENRFKFSLWHSGEGYQLDDQGRLPWLEWAPQVTDSNLGVQNPELHYHPLEGLTPGADWVLRLDLRGELRPGPEIQDVLVHVSVTFSRATTAPDPLLGVSHAR